MPLVISDDELTNAGIDAGVARIELACRLFDIGKLALWPAAQLAGCATRSEFEAMLLQRGIPIYRPTIEEVREDVENLKRLGY